MRGGTPDPSLLCAAYAGTGHRSGAARACRLGAPRTVAATRRRAIAMGAPPDIAARRRAAEGLQISGQSIRERVNSHPEALAETCTVLQRSLSHMRGSASLWHV